MTDSQTSPTGARRPNARDAKRAARTARGAASAPYIVRKIPRFEVLDDEGLSIIERNADRILEETGIEFREDPEVLDIFRKAGAQVDGERVRFPAGMCRALIQQHAPREFTQIARNPARDLRTAVTPRCSRRPTVRPSCATSMRAAATPVSTTSRTS